MTRPPSNSKQRARNFELDQRLIAQLNSAAVIALEILLAFYLEFKVRIVEDYAKGCFL